MKNKVIAVLLLLTIILTACSAGDTTPAIPKAVVVNNDGETEELSADEICSIYEENGAKYSSKYQGAEITVLGTVDSVDYYLENFAGSRKTVYSIVLQEGYRITVLEEFHEEVIDLSKEDKVEIVSELQLCHLEVNMQDIGKRGGAWYDDTIIKVVE